MGTGRKKGECGEGGGRNGGKEQKKGTKRDRLGVRKECVVHTCKRDVLWCEERKVDERNKDQMNIMKAYFSFA